MVRTNLSTSIKCNYIYIIGAICNDNLGFCNFICSRRKEPSCTDNKGYVLENGFLTKQYGIVITNAHI